MQEQVRLARNFHLHLSLMFFLFLQLQHLLLLLQDSLINQHQRIRSTLLRTVVGPEFSVLRTDVVKFIGPEIELQLRITRKRLKDAIETIAYELQILSDKL